MAPVSSQPAGWKYSLIVHSECSSLRAATQRSKQSQKSFIFCILAHAFFGLDSNIVYIRGRHGSAGHLPVARTFAVP